MHGDRQLVQLGVPDATPSPVWTATASRPRFREQVALHGRRLASYATAFGRRLGLTSVEIDTLDLGGRLHDIGKHAIHEDVLYRCGALTADEFGLVKEHTLVGDEICAALPALAHVRDIVRHHHERLDGTGYPDGLVGGELSLLVQVVGIADVFDALMHERSYKPALDLNTACATLAVEAEMGWRDCDLVWKFIAMVRDVREHDALQALAAVRA